MGRLSLGSLRLRLIMLVLLAIVPAIILIVHSDLGDRQRAIEQAKKQVLEAAQQASRVEARTIGQARQLFMTLSHFPPVIQHDATACTHIFAELMKTTKGFSAFLVTGANGITFATYPTKKKAIDLNDRPYFKEALKSGQFVVGHYVIGRVSGTPVLTLAYPVKRANGELAAVLVAGLKTGWINDLLEKSDLPKDAHLSVLDAQGRTLARIPAAADMIGQAKFNPEVRQKLFAKGEGTIEALDPDGKPRFYGFTHLGKKPGGLYVLFSIPKENIFLEPNQALAQDLAWASVVLIIAIILAWLMGTASVVRPVRRLLGVAQRVAKGDLKARVGGPYHTGELDLLARGFDDMAASLEVREAANKKAEEALRQNEVRFRTVADFTYDWEWWRDMEGNFVYVSPSCRRITGYDAEEFANDKDLLLKIVHPEDRASVGRHMDAALHSDDPLNLDFRIITRPGKVIWLEHISQPVFGPDQERLGRRASNRDGTERKQVLDELAQQNALKSGQSTLADLMRGNQEVKELSQSVLSFICQHLGFEVGVFYLPDEEGVLKLTASHAFQGSKNRPTQFRPGEGLVGQAARQKSQLTLEDIPEDYLNIGSGLGQTQPRHILIKPIMREDRVRAVVELGSLEQLSSFQTMFLEAISEGVAVAINSAEGRKKLAEALQESQAFSEELQAQQEELRTTNEELEERTIMLKQSEERLKAQQEELQVTNEELEEKNDLLARQKDEVEWAREAIQEKARELELASKYKSEFLANMSHELRTPLNSLLLLAQALAGNKEGNLSEEQVEFAQIIYASGSDLLNLINEILDLAKIEAGRVALRLGEVNLAELAEGVRASFGHMARQKDLELKVEVAPDAPAGFTSDQKRIEQIIRNLVSNAMKFTEQGGVAVAFGSARLRGESGEEAHLRITVRDTGIGIEPEKQKVIFEAFQQADGSTSRKYGGTGLGLSISRQLALLLGGRIELESEKGKGAVFTVYLPLTPPAELEPSPKPNQPSARPKAPAGPAGPVVQSVYEAAPPPPPPQVQVPDDRENLADDDRVILIIEDDPNFAKVLYKKCHDKGLKCLAALDGETGLELARHYLPGGIILDLRLPGMDGWAVLEALKENTSTRHIPVHIISVEQSSPKAMRKGAVGHATKPINADALDEAFLKLEEVAAQGAKRVLVVEDNEQLRRQSVGLISGGDVEVDEVSTGAEAMEALRGNRYHCVVLDLGLPDMDGRELLEKLGQEGVALPPIIVHTARELTVEEEAALREDAESIVIKDVRSQERLLDEVSLFLHRMVSQMPSPKRQIIRNLHESDALLQGKKVLVVDDDMRTTFALSALLSEYGMSPIKADNGQRALKLLEDNPEVDLVLMDIMMPVMDGYQTMAQIRSQEKYRKLPIIALTAKAMPADREKCLAAGANDYLPKPVDKAKLLSMIRVWLYR